MVPIKIISIYYIIKYNNYNHRKYIRIAKILAYTVGIK